MLVYYLPNYKYWVNHEKYVNINRKPRKGKIKGKIKLLYVPCNTVKKQTCQMPEAVLVNDISVKSPPELNEP